MKYNGGKGRCQGMTKIINGIAPRNSVYWEPFVGSGKVIENVSYKTRIGTDIDKHIITLLQSIQERWKPPSVVTEEDYQKWKQRARKGLNDPMIGFVGYGCCFSGRFMQGFARTHTKTELGRSFSAEAKSSLLKQKHKLTGVRLDCIGYAEASIEADIIYCDPPYDGTKNVGADTTRFNSKQFWKWCIRKSKTSIVLVSEYNCPIPTAEVLWSKIVSTGLRRNDGTPKKEYLFCLSPSKSVHRVIGFGLARKELKSHGKESK